MLDLPQQFNVATHFVDRNVSEGRGEKVAIECGDERVSYRHLLEWTNRVGNALRGLGVRPEERVFLLLPDTPEFLYCFFGAIKIGAVAVPTNTLLKPHEYEYLLNDTRARIATHNGWPVIDRFFRSTDSSTFFVGYAAEHRFGPLSRFVLGAEFAALRVRQAIEG